MRSSLRQLIDYPVYNEHRAWNLMILLTIFHLPDPHA